MYDLHDLINRFYNDHVRLGTPKREILAENRNVCIDRLKVGLDQLGHSNQFRKLDQGSYAMHTLNQAIQNDYDIDVGLIFDAQDLPDSALNARRQIKAGMIKGGGNFSRPPEAITNAVRVYYSAGHHIDFAIYRAYENEYGSELIEHAGSDWTVRNPNAVTDWFIEQVGCKSPIGISATVKKNQLRRVVRLLKCFARARAGENLPGGLVISVLGVECYVPDYTRDDISLWETMERIYSRLLYQTEINHPSAGSPPLTNKKKYVDQVINFRNAIEEALDKIKILRNAKCTEEEALDCMDWMFSHKYWRLAANAKSMGLASSAGGLYIMENGVLTLKPTTEKTTLIPSHRFFGGSSND